MKPIQKFFLLVLLSPAPGAAEVSLGQINKPYPFLGEGIDSSVQETVAPAYRFVEGISDSVYDFMRRHVIGSILPGRLSRDLKAAPLNDSAPLFDRKLHDKEGRFMARARAAYPIATDTGVTATQVQLEAWRSWAADEQVSVVIDTLKDTLVERYQLELFGKTSENYAKDRRHWDPGLITMASLVGGTFFYINGLHASGHIGALKVGLDLRSGLKLRQSLQNPGQTNRLAGLELGYKNQPLTLATEWGLSSGHLRNERVGLNYRLRY